jgi:hypothetical protein
VVSVVIRSFNVDLVNAEWAEGKCAEWLAVVMYVALIAYLAWDCMRAKKEE